MKVTVRETSDNCYFLQPVSKWAIISHYRIMCTGYRCLFILCFWGVRSVSSDGYEWSERNTRWFWILNVCYLTEGRKISDLRYADNVALIAVGHSTQTVDFNTTHHVKIYVVHISSNIHLFLLCSPVMSITVIAELNQASSLCWNRQSC